MIALLLPALLQVTPVAPIVKGTGLPPPSAEEAAVLAPVEAILAAIPRHDGAAITAQLFPGGSATVAVERPDGTRRVRRLTLTEFTGMVSAGKEEVREVQGTPAIEIDGDIAMVWAPFTFYAAGKVAHCGTNHFDLVREAGRWKVANITWSQRTTGCTAQ